MHLFSINSEGEVHDHVGNWINENTLEVYWRGTFEDQELEEKITAKWVTKDQIELKEISLSLGQSKYLQLTTFLKENKANQAN